MSYIYNSTIPHNLIIHTNSFIYTRSTEIPHKDIYDPAVYDDRHICDIFDEIVEDIEHQLWSQSRDSINFVIKVEFKYSIREENLTALRNVINIKNSKFMNDFPILRHFAVGIFISQDFIIIKASKLDLDED